MIFLFAAALSFAAADDHILVTSKQYPSYGLPENLHAAKAASFPTVPVIYDCRWPEGTSHHFFVMDEDQILPAGRRIWSCHDPDLGFCLGCNCMCVCENGTTLYGKMAEWHPRRRWYLWFRWHGKSAHQPLGYAFSDIGSPYAPLDEAGVGSDEAFFAPVTGSAYLKYWEIHSSFLSPLIKLSIPATDPKEPLAVIWRQYAAICPKTFTDTLREGFGWEGPNVYPEPNDGVLVPAIDLRPGMRLRVDYAMYADPTVIPRPAVASSASKSDRKPALETASKLESSFDAGAADSLHRGYVGTGTSYFAVTRMPSHFDGALGAFGSRPKFKRHSVLVLDGFFGHMSQSMGVPGIRTNDMHPNVVASPLDTALHPYEMNRHLRLVYPKDGRTSEAARLLGTTNDGLSELHVDVKNHPALVTADSRAGLSAGRLAQFVEGSHFKVDPPIDEEGRRLFVLRGRTLPIPEIAIKLNGVETFVPCGTRLRQLAERHLEGPPSMLARQIRLHRRVEGKPVAVSFRNDDTGMVLEIPLMKGDVVGW